MLAVGALATTVDAIGPLDLFGGNPLSIFGSNPLQLAYSSWARNYNKPSQVPDLISSVWGQRQRNVFGHNNARLEGSYLKQANGYSDVTYDNFANTHLGSNQDGFWQVNATSKPKKHRHGLHGGRLAGVIIGSVLGGLLLLGLLIALIFCCRRRRARARGGLYTEHNNVRTQPAVATYQTEVRRDPYLDRPVQTTTAPVTTTTTETVYRERLATPQDNHVYRESHRSTLNQGYVNETTASDRFQTENIPTYQDRNVTYTDRTTLVPRGETVQFHN
ncbi:hypothetical protein SAMD00019534_064370 [Acytostelium subglobosum LB1]|uniref:hypothetical protein n=1 Tax=Acytostelium subglobosum LB1 TaxID=1410327 RepID=UPI000644B272|nr:hypothetical protein SAMD00019534_064370 [Acytostelium subglobosum LB1]GAM23262.1 hypothetical protein SAMD00019534_064370 [Acytostelium subglobosum LB1]|eukprot:XP_012753711.1 hypothetical protein SAMD00019534_064370 [Acytostelium subglobosum LB1]